MRIGGEAEARARRVDRFAAIAAVALVGALVVVLGRVVQLQAFPSERLEALAAERFAVRSAQARRGDVLDRRGRPLASTRTGWRVFVDPHLIEHPYMPTLNTVADLTGVPTEAVVSRVMARVARNERRAQEGRGPIRYVSVGGELTDGAVARAQQELPVGVHLETIPVRELVQGEAAELVGSIIGRVDVNQHGLGGVEAAFDEQLGPSPGALVYMPASSGEPMWIEPDGIEPPTPGEPLRLSIDLTLQQILREELDRALVRNDASGARGVMVDPHTGEVLAMLDRVRRPVDAVEFDGEVAGAAARGEREWPRFVVVDPPVASEPALAYNRCVRDVYEPGSTFKPFAWALVTERGVFSPADELDTESGVWRQPNGRVLRDVAARDRQTWGDVLINSSNIGMAKGTDELTHEELRAGVLRFGFGESTRLPIDHEADGLVTPMASWSDFTQTSVAFGYEIAVTPLQMARAFSVFARGGAQLGTLPRLRLTAAGEADRAAIELRVRVLPEWVAGLVRTLLEEVASRMEVWAARDYPEDPPTRYAISGKSGTSRMVRPDGRGYLPRQYHASFVAMAPVESPRIVVVVVVDDPGPSRVAARRHFGSRAAGPAVRNIVQRTLPYFGVPAQSVDLSSR
ncbi:MAG: penicillin-binding protein 2 [Planctomycetota bacterium]